MDFKKYSAYIGIGIMALLFAVAIFFGKQQEKKKALEERANYERIQAELEKDTFRTEDEIYERLENAIMSGESDNVYMSVPGTFSKEDIERIGKRIDPMIARVKLFSYATSSQQDGDGPVVEDYFVGIN